MQHRHPNQPPLPMHVSFGIAASASGIAHSIFYPTNTILSRLQINPTKITSMGDALRVIFRDTYHKGIFSKLHSLYSGFFVAGFYKVSSRAVKYGGQPVTANYIGNFNGVDALAGALMGIVDVALFFPFDTLKIKRQNGNRIPLREIVFTEKWNLYRGSSITLARNIIGYSVLFESSAHMLTALEKTHSDHRITLVDRLTAAVSANTINSIATSPLDVVKVRMQTSPVKISPVSMFKQIINQEGLLALYKGVTIKILSTAPKKSIPLAITGYLFDAWDQHEMDALCRKLL